MAYDDDEQVPVSYEDDEEEKQKGAPPDFPGVVLPNPNGIRPLADTDSGVEPDKLTTAGTSFSDKNFSGPLKGNYAYPGVQLNPDVSEREASGKTAPGVQPISLAPPNSQPARPIPLAPPSGAPGIQATPLSGSPQQYPSLPPFEPALPRIDDTRPKWSDYAPAEPKGFWSKLGHGLAAVNPRTDLIFNQRPREKAIDRYNAAVSEYEAPGKEAAQKATTEHTEAETGAIPAHTELEKAQAAALSNPSDWKGQTGVVNAQGQPLELNEKTGQYRWGNVSGATPIKTPAETMAQRQIDMEKIGKAVQFSGDPKKIPQELHNAVADGRITQDQADDYNAYRMDKGDQGTKVSVPIEVHSGEEGTDIDKKFTGSEVIANIPDGKGGFSRVQMPYGDARKRGIDPRDMTILNGKEAQENRDKMASVNTTMDMVKRYRNDFKTAQLNDQDRAALGVLTSAQDKIADSFLGVTESGVIDTLIGKPLTGYSEKLMGSWLSKQQYDNLSKDGRKMMADYVSTILENFNNIKATMGSVPRNPQIIAMEVRRVPMPFLDFESASPAFDNFRDAIRDRTHSLPQIQ